MAGTSQAVDVRSVDQEPEASFRREINALVADVETLRAELVALYAAQLAGGVAVSAAPNAAIGTVSAAEIAIDAFTVVVKGVPVSVSAQEVAFTATTHDIADPDTNPREANFLLCINGAGTPVLAKGADAAAAAAVDPNVPTGTVAVARINIQHDGSAIFNATTDDLDAAHLTATFTDLAQVFTAPAASALTAATIGTF